MTTYDILIKLKLNWAGDKTPVIMWGKNVRCTESQIQRLRVTVNKGW